MQIFNFAKFQIFSNFVQKILNITNFLWVLGSSTSAPQLVASCSSMAPSKNATQESSDRNSMITFSQKKNNSIILSTATIRPTTAPNFQNDPGRILNQHNIMNTNYNSKSSEVSDVTVVSSSTSFSQKVLLGSNRRSPLPPVVKTGPWQQRAAAKNFSKAGSFPLAANLPPNPNSKSKLPTSSAGGKSEQGRPTIQDLL